jgi:hypothetical protein
MSFPYAVKTLDKNLLNKDLSREKKQFHGIVFNLFSIS